MPGDGIRVHVLRLKPGEDLRTSIAAYVTDHRIEAGWIVTCVGSLLQVNVRFANQGDATVINGPFEITSLTGTLSVRGCHIHISVSDEKGQTTGGHLLEGSLVYTTAEIVLQESEDYLFRREKDGTTHWNELQIERREEKPGGR